MEDSFIATQFSYMVLAIAQFPLGAMFVYLPFALVFNAFNLKKFLPWTK